MTFLCLKEISFKDSVSKNAKIKTIISLTIYLSDEISLTESQTNYSVKRLTFNN